MTARAEWLAVGGPIEPWERLGLAVRGGMVSLFGTGIFISGEGEPGLHGWALSGVADDVTSIDGLATRVVVPPGPILCEHPLGAVGLDHVVIVTDSLERTCGAITEVTGALRKRVREVGGDGEMRQGFHRLGSLVVEVVERAGLPEGPAGFWGLVLNVEDIDVAVDHLGPELVGPPKPAVQPGRSIATVRTAAGLGLPVALMTS